MSNIISYYINTIHLYTYYVIETNHNHRCMKLCFMDCGACTVPMLKELPCGHQIELPCSVDSVTFPCNEKVK